MKIAKYLGLFLLLLFLIDFIGSKSIGILYNSTFTGQTGGKINNLLTNYRDVDVLILGDSRCAHHVVPDSIGTSSFNLSHNGMSLVYHTGLINQLLTNESISADTILLHLELYEAFESSNKYQKDIQHLKYYFHDNDWIRMHIQTLSRFETLKNYSFSYKWNGKVMSILSNWIKSNRGQFEDAGYVPKNANSRDSVNVKWDLERRISLEKESNVLLNENYQSYLKSLKEWCNRMDVQLICFTSPTYQNVTGNFYSSEVLEKYLQSIGIPYINYQNDKKSIPELSSIWLWHDSMHLNGNGAAIFSKRLKKDIMNFHSSN